MPRILIIEDEENVREALCSALETVDYEVGAAADGAEGLACFQAEQWDLVLLDYRMPGKSGLEVLAALRELDASTPVIMVTGVDTVEMGAEALGAGARGFLTKPISVTELRELVTEALSPRTS